MCENLIDGVGGLMKSFFGRRMGLWLLDEDDDDDDEIDDDDTL